MTNMTVEQMTKIVYDAIDDKLGQDISIINIGKVSSLCDYFVIATLPNFLRIFYFYSSFARNCCT